jgi:beta-lactamase regulating signal transducer with metallopeptidase domain
MNFQELTTQLLANSWRAGILIIVLCAVRGFLPRFIDARVIYWFWVLVAVRLLLPFDVPVPTSAAPYFPQVPWTDATVESLSVYGSMTADSSGDRSLREILFNEKFLAAIWLAGVGVVLLASVAANVSFRRQLSRSSRRAGKRTDRMVYDCAQAMGENSVRALEMDGLSGPALFGVWRPRLLFPAGLAEQLSDEELRLVVLHELGHLKRRDLFLQGLLVVSQAVHWFNPLVWLAGRLAREDRELACDEFVMAHTSHSGSHAYAKTLLRVLGLTRPGRPMLPAVGILETKNKIKQRIIMITKYQSTNARRLLLGAASILAVSAGLLMVNAAESGSNASAAASPETSDAQLNSSSNPKAAIGDPKAGKIIIPKINFTDVSVEKALEFLRAKSRELDPEKKGVEIILKDSHKSKDAVIISMSLTDVPLFEVVRYVAESANLEVNWVGKAIVLTSRAEGESSVGSTENSESSKME